LDPSTVERVAAEITSEEEAFPWDRVSELLGVDVEQVKTLISVGQLRVLDTFVADRAFEDFCKKCGHEFNLGLMDPAAARWLVKEYGVPASASEDRTVSRAQKHALTIRTCKCGRKIAGNVYFRHIKSCSAATRQAKRKAV
jgi:hypothetical protein